MLIPDEDYRRIELNDQIVEEFVLAASSGSTPVTIDEYVERCDPKNRTSVVREMLEGVAGRQLEQGRAIQLESCAGTHIEEARQVEAEWLKKRRMADTVDQSHGQLGEFTLLDLIGEGGFGRVYRARQNSLNRIVAVKVLMADALEQVERFQQEAELLADFEHENIVSIHTRGKKDGKHFIVMEYMDGGSLDDKLRHGPIPSREAAQYCHQIACGLEAAHDNGVIHRDLKPSNVLIDAASGRAKITDFGFARRVADPHVTQSGKTVGSLHYMPPEQLEGQEPDPRFDVYSLGASLYALLTGEPPFDNLADIVNPNKKPDPPSKKNRNVAATLDEICLKCLEKDPKRRFQTAAEVRDRLESCDFGIPEPRWHHRPLVWATCLMGVASLVVGVVVGTMRSPTSDQTSGGVMTRATGPQAVAVEQALEGGSLEAVGQEKDDIPTQPTKLDDIIQAFEALDYRYAEDAPGQERLWETKFREFKDRASQGDPLAMAGLHYCYSKGLGTNKDDDEAYRWAKQASETNHAVGDHVLGRCYLLGIGVERNKKSGYQLIDETADEGFPISQYTTANQLLYSGDPSDADVNAAMNLLEVATQAGLPSAEYLLGLLLVKGTETIERQTERGLRLIEAAARRGAGGSRYHLYEIYSSKEDESVKQDREKAAMWLRRSAAAGFARGQLGLARELYRGLDEIGMQGGRLNLAEDPAEARFWVQLAAEQGLGEAHLILAHMLFQGDGGKKDYAAARSHCEEAARLDHSGAWALQGEWYLTGQVYNASESKALTVLRKAVGAKNPAGAFWMGRLMEQQLARIGTPTISVERFRKSAKVADAAAFYAIASRMGHKPAGTALEAMDGQLDELALDYIGRAAPGVLKHIQARRAEQERAERRVIQLGSGELQRFSHLGPVSYAGFRNGSNQVVSAGSSIRDGSIRVWDVATRSEVFRLDGHTKGVANLVVSNDGELAFSFESGRVIGDSPGKELYIWDMVQERLKAKLKYERRVYGLAISPDKSSVAVGDTRDDVRVRDIPSGEMTQKFDARSVYGYLAYSPSGSELIVPGRHGRLAVWDVATGTERIRINTSEHPHSVTDLAVGGDRWFATSHLHEDLVLWDLQKGHPVQTFKGHTSYVSSVALSHDGRLVLSGGGTRLNEDDCSVRLWDAESGQELKRFDGHRKLVNSVAISPDGKLGVSGSEDGTVRVWNLTIPND